MPEEFHRYHDLIQIFDDLFFDTLNTRLIKGGDEPVYIPANAECSYHQVIFAHGYYASALHEIAHWCVAGEERRLKQDFGYWYCPDGRDQATQAEFEKVEVVPQAIEWAFSVAAGKSFRVSTDNLNGAEPNRALFQQNVFKQVKQYLLNGFSERTQLFIDALRRFYGTPELTLSSFSCDLDSKELYDQAV